MLAEGLNAVNGQIPVERVNLTAQGGGQLLRLDARAQMYDRARLIMLKQRQVEHRRPCCFKQVTAFDVARHADDFGRLIGVRSHLQLQPLAQRVFIRPNAARQSLIDDRNARRLRVIALGKLAAQQQRDVHRLQIARRDEVLEGLYPPVVFPLRINSVLPAAVVQRQCVRKSCRLYAGQRLQAFKELSMEALALGLVVILFAEVNPRRQHALDFIACVNAARIAQSPDAQPCGDEQRERERDLCHYQRPAQARPAATRPGQPRVFQSLNQVGLRRLKRGDKAEQHSRQNRYDQRKTEDAPIHAEVQFERQEKITLRQQAAQPFGQPYADE